MKILGLTDIDQYIKINDTMEVTTQAIYTSGGAFHPNGLFSEEIFGQTEDARWYRCSFIKLPLYIFNPLIAKTIISRGGGIIKKCAYGEARCTLINGVLTQKEDGEYCGFKDIYNIWEKIDLDKTLKTRADDNLVILKKSPKHVVFTNKILVVPPNFRQIGMKNGKQARNELNTMYMHLLGLKTITAHSTTNTIYQVYNKFQEASINIYTYLQNFVSSKNGYFQKALLAKNSTWSVRNVISAPKYDTDDTPISIFRSGYPLHSVVSLFYPIIRFNVKQFLTFNNIQMIHPNKEEVKSGNIENIYDDKMIDDILLIYMKNPGSRFKILYLDPENTKPIMFEALDVKTNQPISRPLTITDVIYICCKHAVVDGDKMVYTVRYPIGDYMGAFFTKVHVLSTNKTTKIIFQNEKFDYYPIIDTSLPHRVVATSFADTMTPSNSNLPKWNGDYDGDTVKSVGIFSDEANEQARNIMYSKVACVKTQYTSPFSHGKECINGLYSLTKGNE